MKLMSRLIISILAVFLFSCVHYEPMGYYTALSFTYEGVNLTKHKVKGSRLYDYTGAVSATGGTLTVDIPHTAISYNYYISMIESVRLDNTDIDCIRGQLPSNLPEDGIEFSGNWGKIQSELLEKNTLYHITLDPNDTGKTREITIHFSYCSSAATIILNQEK